MEQTGADGADRSRQGQMEQTAGADRVEQCGSSMSVCVFMVGAFLCVHLGLGVCKDIHERRYRVDNFYANVLCFHTYTRRDTIDYWHSPCARTLIHFAHSFILHTHTHTMQQQKSKQVIVLYSFEDSADSAHSFVRCVDSVSILRA